MSDLSTFLTFNDQAQAAADLYTSIFPDSRITGMTRYPEGGPAPAGSVMTVSFELDGRPFVALNGGPHFSFSEGVSISVQCSTQEEIDHYWDRLSEGGREGDCGWLTDRFGVSWQVNPTLLMEMLGDPDPDRARRAFEVMCTMKKIDLDTLRRAWDD